MDALGIAAASGMRARMESLEMLANNLANSGTAGFKADREFYNLYRSASASPGQSGAPLIEKNWIDFAQGALTTTGKDSDLALAGPGFFVIDGPGGPLLTRSGGFHLSKYGNLETQDGFKVQGGDGKPVKLDPSLPFQVRDDGALVQGGAETAQLKLVEPADPRALIKAGHNYFTAPDTLPRATKTEVVQGRLESANVSPAESAVRMVSVMRQFESLQRALTLANEMDRRVTDEVAKIHG